MEPRRVHRKRPPLVAASHEPKENPGQTYQRVTEQAHDLLKTRIASARSDYAKRMQEAERDYYNAIGGWRDA